MLSLSVIAVFLGSGFRSSVVALNSVSTVSIVELKKKVIAAAVDNQNPSRAIASVVSFYRKNSSFSPIHRKSAVVRKVDKKEEGLARARAAIRKAAGVRNQPIINPGGIYRNLGTFYHGFTNSNYTQLTELHNKYKDKGFEVLAFPCNQFLKQEPGTSEEAQQFACTRFKAEYPIFQKTYALTGLLGERSSSQSSLLMLKKYRYKEYTVQLERSTCKNMRPVAECGR